MTPFSLPLSTFTTTAISLTAAVGLSSCQHQEDGVFNTGGAKRPEDWVLTVPEKKQAYTNPHSGTRARTRIYNLSTIAPFAAYCGQEVHLSPACAIKRLDYAGGINYTLIDHTPLPDGAIDLYSMPVQQGRLLAVRGWFAEKAPEGSDSFTTTRRMVEALVEVQHPDTTVNQGRPLYLVYNLGHEGTKVSDDVYTDIRRAPWEPADAPATRSITSLFEEIEQKNNSTKEKQ
jgi:hypothetical protein